MLQALNTNSIKVKSGTYLLRCQSGRRIGVKDFSEEAPDFLVSKIGGQSGELAALNLAEEVCFELAKERKLAHVDDV